MAMIKQLNSVGDGTPQEHDLGTAKYKFEMDADGNFCCEVKNPAHAKLLLSHKDDFVLLKEDTSNQTLEEQLSAMKKDDLVEFALTEHGLALDSKLKVGEMRDAIIEDVAEKAAAATAAAE